MAHGAHRPSPSALCAMRFSILQQRQKIRNGDGEHIFLGVVEKLIFGQQHAAALLQQRFGVVSISWPLRQ